jgi:hypothetical protein
MFKDGRKMLTIKSDVVGRPSVTSDDLIRGVNKKKSERRLFTVSKFSYEFQQISRSVLCEIITVKLSQVLRKMVSETTHGWAQKAENGLGFYLDSLERYHKDGDGSLNYTFRVTGDEIWVSFLNVEINVQSKQRMHTHSRNKPKQFKQTSPRKLMAAVFWDRKGVLRVKFM